MLCCVNNKYDNMIYYYMLAIDKGNSDAMYELGCYYDKIDNTSEAVNYLDMAIDKGNHNALYEMGCMYDEDGKYYEAIEYYLMAINKGNSKEMNNLGCYYENIEKDYNKAIEYYLMSINKGNFNAKLNLEILFIKNIDIYIKYILSNNYNPDNLKLCFIKDNLIKDKFECPICYDNFDYYIKTYCNHRYCYNCYYKLDSCAMCRRDV